MFTAAPFTTAKTWNHPKCPLTDEWIKKMWCIYIYIMEYYSAIKRNEMKKKKRIEMESFAVMWMNLEPVIQSGVSQQEKKTNTHIKTN